LIPIRNIAAKRGRLRYSERVLGRFQGAERNTPGALLCALALCLAACSDDAPACVQDLGADCQPLYEPVYEQVFERTLKPRCALEGGSCHSREGAQGGLIMEDLDETYENLVTAGRALPGDVSCSLLVVRLDGGGGLMPPGAPLTDAERCSIETWVREGAEK
jgi:hypothetical protein